MAETRSPKVSAPQRRFLLAAIARGGRVVLDSSRSARTLAALRKRGLVESSKSGYCISESGREAVRS